MTTEKNSPKPLQNFLLTITIGALAGALSPTIYEYFKTGSFEMIKAEDIPQIITNIYNYAPIPLRIAYYAWLTTFILYAYAERFDKYHCNLPRIEKEKNFKPWVFGVLAALAVVNHLFQKESLINKWAFHLPDTIWATGVVIVGYIALCVGFYCIFLARPAINGYWGPHLYKYKEDEHNKLVDYGIYRSFRHPIYLGQILMSAGTFLLANNWIAILFPAYMIYINSRRARKEEKHLEEIFGAQFIEYKEKTGMWLPRMPLFDK